jgi:hypothetical protein
VWRDNTGRVVGHLAVWEGMAVTDKERGTSFDLVIQGIEDDIHAAERAGCVPEGHSAICRAQTGIARAIAHTYDRVVGNPAATVALLRSQPDSALAGVPATPGWHEIAKRFAATLAASPWAIVGIVGLFAVSPSLRELARALVEAMR